MSKDRKGPVFRTGNAITKYLKDNGEMYIHDSYNASEYGLQVIEKCDCNNIEMSFDDGKKYYSMDQIAEGMKLYENRCQYTREQLQKAYQNGYNKGVENKPYIDKYEEWIKDEQ